MNIVILGAGPIGAYVAKTLAAEEHNVIIVDKDEQALEKISNKVDAATITGYASDWKIFDDLLEHEPDFFIALTDKDEVNLSTCMIAKNLGYPKTICQIKDPGYLKSSRIDFKRLFFIDYFIGADVLIAQDILKSIISPESSIFTESFAHGAIQMRTILVPEDWKYNEVPLAKLDIPDEIILGLIRRHHPHDEIKIETEEKEKIIIPRGQDHIIAGDEVTLIGQTNAMEKIDNLFNVKEEKLKSVVIVGGSKAAIELAKILQRFSVRIKFFEKDEKKCQHLADIFPEATILHHDGKDLEFLIAEKVDKKDTFIACTQRDETNFLLSAIGKQAGCEKVIALLSDSKLAPILRQLNIRFSISKKVNIANHIMSVIHADTVLSVASLCDNQAKVFEIKVSYDSKIIGIPLSELGSHLPSDLLIAVIVSRGQVIIGKGNRVISPNDTVIVITRPKSIEELHHLF